MTKRLKATSSKNGRWTHLIDILRDVIFANRPYLSDHEEQVLLFIFQRTRMFGKEWDKIPLRHFTGGVWSRENGAISSRLTLKANSVIQALKHLQSKGLIEIQPHATKAYKYRIVTPAEIAHHDIVSYLQTHQEKQLQALVLELQRNEGHLPAAFAEVLRTVRSSPQVGQRKPAIPRDRTAVSARVTNAVSPKIKPTIKRPNLRLRKPTTNKIASKDAVVGDGSAPTVKRQFKINALPKKEMVHGKSSASDTVLALIEAANWQHLQREARMQTSAFAKWDRAWRDAMCAHWKQEVAELSGATLGKLRKAIDAKGLPSEGVPQFLNWVVQNWSLLRRTAFSFSTTRPWGPTVPDLGYTIAMLPKLHFHYMLQIPRPDWGPPEERRSDWRQFKP